MRPDVETAYTTYRTLDLDDQVMSLTALLDTTPTTIPDPFSSPRHSRMADVHYSSPPTNYISASSCLSPSTIIPIRSFRIHCLHAKTTLHIAQHVPSVVP